jgi:hypothetical protein
MVRSSGPFHYFLRDQYAESLKGLVEEHVAAAYDADHDQLIQWLESLGRKQTRELQAQAREWLNAEPSEPWEEGCNVVPIDGYEYAYFFFASGYGTILASGLGVAVSGGEYARAYFDKPPSLLVKASVADIIANRQICRYDFNVYRIRRPNLVFPCDVSGDLLQAELIERI